MDSRRFDNLARALGRPASRRGALGILAGGAALAARLAAFDRADGVVAAPRRKAAKGAGGGRGPQKVPVCHEGHTLLLPPAAVEAHLAHGDTLGACGAPGAGTCVPNDQICTVASPVRCCGDKTFCRPTLHPGIWTCQTACDAKSPSANADCEKILGYPDVQCTESVTACAGSLGQCCRPKECSGNSDCRGGGLCCPTLLGPNRCCAPGQVCAVFGGCANP